jgi:hypothetical protein
MVHTENRSRVWAIKPTHEIKAEKLRSKVCEAKSAIITLSHFVIGGSNCD